MFALGWLSPGAVDDEEDDDDELPEDAATTAAVASGPPASSDHEPEAALVGARTTRSYDVDLTSPVSPLAKHDIP